MHEFTSLDVSRIAQDLQVRKTQVEGVVQLLDEGNTIPFITRYRKERTGGLNEDILRQIQLRVDFQRQLAERKKTILKSIEGQGKLTDGLRAAILAADTSKRLDDLYLPYKPKKRSLAAAAREKGLEPLALAVWNRDPAVANLADSWTSFVNPDKGLTAPEDVRAGVLHILAEMTAEVAAVRAVTRSLLWETGKICSVKSEKVPDGQGLEYRDYFDFGQPLRHIPPHRILAINRGEKETALKTCLDFKADDIRASAMKAFADHLLETQSPPPGAPPAPDLGESPGEALCRDSAYQTPQADLLRIALDDALTRLVLPSLEREIRRELTEEAEAHAVMVFGRNLRALLLQPPLQGRRLLAIDPGFRAGCKVAALDEHGNYLEHTVVHPHPVREREKKKPKKEPASAPPPSKEASTVSNDAATPPVAVDATPVVESASSPPAEATPPVVDTPAPSTEVAATSTEATVESPVTADTGAVPSEPTPPPGPTKRDEAKSKLCELVSRHNLNLIVIGNGTACRETEEFIAELIRDNCPDLAYVIVNEAGASVYSASSIGREEFPDHDATVRGTISIGRRLQDPLSELVKVDPHNIGVGLYQHDVNPRNLKSSLDGVVESCVNQIGVDLNTASVPLLRHVAGLNQLVARDIVEFRKAHGPFKAREQLLQVPNIGPARYVQAAGFLKILDGENALDRTWVHPESYGVAARLLADLGFGPEALTDKSRQGELREKLRHVGIEETAIRLQVGVPTLHDMLEALARPSRDPRDDLPAPVFKKGVLRMEDLTPGMELKGTVLNVVDFGAFVDVGLKESGLVHISEMGNRYIKSAYDIVAVSDVVTVWVLKVDQERHRVSLSMVRPGSQRRPPERRPQGDRQQQPGGDAQRDQRPRAPQGRPGDRPQDQRGPRPQGRHAGPPQRRGQGPRQGGRPADGPGSGSQQGGPPPRPAPPPPRKPRREPPRPKLSQEALEGKAPLRTFAELGALFAAKQTPPSKPAPPAEVKSAGETVPPTAPSPETPPVVTAKTDAAPAEQPHLPQTPQQESAAPPQ